MGLFRAGARATKSRCQFGDAERFTIGRQPARAHASNKNPRAHPARSQNSDRACTLTQSVGFMNARVDGSPRMRWYGVDCQDAARPPMALRNLLRWSLSMSTANAWRVRKSTHQFSRSMAKWATGQEGMANRSVSSLRHTRETRAAVPPYVMWLHVLNTRPQMHLGGLSAVEIESGRTPLDAMYNAMLGLKF